jgi:hypothetical protein
MLAKKMKNEFDKFRKKNTGKNTGFVKTEKTSTKLKAPIFEIRLDRFNLLRPSLKRSH